MRMDGVKVILRYLLLAVAASLLLPGAAATQTMIPPVWDIVADDFESGNLAAWTLGGTKSAALTPGGGYGGSTGLSVPIDQAANHIAQSRFAKATEGYLTFWFNPNHATIPDPDTYWLPANSLYVAGIVSSESWWPPLVALYVRYETGEGYKGFLAWPNGEESYYDTENEFDITPGWQRISIGYRIDGWVGIWIDEQLVHAGAPGDNLATYGDVIYVGKVNSNSSITPSGALLFDDVAFQIPRLTHLWVDAYQGSDENNGLTSDTAFQTIQKAADKAGPGVTVHILPGVYRETVRPVLNGTSTEPILYRAENGPGTVALRGSEPSAALAWTQLAANTIGLPASVDPTHIYYTDLSAWELTAAPRFVVELDGAGEVAARLPLAREPDWQVTTEWKTHEFWWAADGGSAPAGCVPSPADPNCDLATRSTTQLTDRTDDAEPTGIEAGNLTTVGDVTGGTLVAIDTFQGHYVYRRAITAHDVGSGRITVDRVCEHDGGSGNPGLGWGSKYYLENRPSLLDTPGEWWYDAATGRLYLWPRIAGNPAAQSIEISRRARGFDLKNRSYTILDGLTIEILDGAAVYLANWEPEHAYDDIVRNVTLRYANWGAYIEQSVGATSLPGNVVDGFVLENSEISYMDSVAIRLIDWWANGAPADSFIRPGVRNTIIRNNEMHHLGFRSDGDNAVGLSFTHANELRFERNHVHHVAHNGVQFSQSVIQSDKTYGFTPDEIKTGGILIKDNIFEKACQLTTDCGGLKFWGSPPDNHVFRDVLITGNVFRDSIGWTYISEKRGRWSGGEGSQVQGLGAFGLYVDHASGIHAYRNVAYNNSHTAYALSGVWRDGQIVYVNNVAANSLYGFVLGGGYDTHGSYDTQVLNNILINNEAFGMSIHYSDGRTANVVVDHNLYHGNGWGPLSSAGPMVVREDGGWEPCETLAAVRAATPWEDHGQEGDPAFYDYDVTDHNLHDGSRPDFHLTGDSTFAIDRGTTSLPASLTALLEAFAVPDYIRGSAFDIGRYEAGFALTATPAEAMIPVGGMARFALRLHPPDLPHPVTLTLGSPPAGFSGALSANLLASDAVVTLTVTHDGSAAGREVWTELVVSGAAHGFVDTVTVAVFVGGERIYLPLVLRQG
ncbi:MAG TPA: right-handed parallel beta-helix repeat-containing protein [Anaerolineae bacterium]|nr:right-handed parallel beta-helix repeat-containing protein [Anaerolineae bacterium]